jgi:HK97 family phage prohead protease
MKTKPVPAEIEDRKVGEKVTLYRSIDKDSVKALDENSGILEAIVTTSDVDRYNENIITSGIDTTNYIEKNPVVLYGHDYYSFPVGKTLKLTQMKNKIKAQFQLAIEEYDFAATLYKLIKGGYINAVSIGGRVLEWSEDYKSIIRMEMVEFSVVAIPANPEAMITARSFETMVGKSMSDVRKEVEQMSQKILLDKLKGIPHDDLNDAIKVLDNLLARLKETATNPSLSDDKSLNRNKRFVLKDAKAIAEQSQKVIKIIKLSTKKD